MSQVLTHDKTIRTFNRFELKYIIHYKQARELVRRLSVYMDLDENAGIGGFYKVESLYYDSPDLACYWEKMDGEKYRRKVRVRTYGPGSEKAFVEIKQRYNLNVQKRRLVGPIQEVDEMMQNIQRGRHTPGVDPVYDEVAVLHYRYRLQPKQVISYQRVAFFDRYKKDLRVTLDRNLKCSNLDLRIQRDRTYGRYALPPTMLVLEVKFNERVPRWLCTCLNSMGLQIQRFSKYTAGVDQTILHPRRLVTA